MKKTKKTNVTKAHIVRMLLKIDVQYPAHKPRRETVAYRAAHNHLVKELDLPCLVCGVRNSTLKDPKENPYKAKMLTTHHHLLEWALTNAVDVNKFNKIILPHLKVRHPDKYNHDFSQQEFEDWVDHDEDNLWVICDVHHMSKRRGIHYLPLSIWQAQDILKDGFELLPKGAKDVTVY